MKTKQTSCDLIEYKGLRTFDLCMVFLLMSLLVTTPVKLDAHELNRLCHSFLSLSKRSFWVPVWFLICNRRSVTKPVNIPTKWQSFQWIGIWTATEMSAHVSVTTVKALSDDMCCREWRRHNCSVISCLVSDDHSRVKLENSENDYINASLVDVEEAQRAYILSQVCRL